jgi:hypothetical protein
MDAKMGNDQVTVDASPGEDTVTPSTWLLAINDSSGEAEVGRDGDESPDATIADEVDSSKKGFAAYFFTKRFYLILLIGYAILNPANRVRCEYLLTYSDPPRHEIAKSSPFASRRQIRSIPSSRILERRCRHFRRF